MLGCNVERTSITLRNDRGTCDKFKLSYKYIEEIENEARLKANGYR